MKSLSVKLGAILLTILILWGCPFTKPEALKEYIQQRIDPSSIDDQEQFRRDLDECIRFGDEEKNKAFTFDFAAVSVQRDAAIDHCMRNKGYKLLQAGESTERR